MININNKKFLNHILNKLKLNKKNYKEKYIKKFNL